MPLRDGRDPQALDEAAHRLAAGGLVAFPTETVYGLGARADDDRAVAAVFAAKGRPADHPLIVHLADTCAAAAFADAIDEHARRLMDAFWPGPLTVIVSRRPGVADGAAAALPTVGLRCPAHPVARALLARAAALGVPGVAAPSANRFGRVSPTRARHVVQEFGDDLLVLDGGDCAHGIESAIVDCSAADPVLLRPGTLARAEIERVLGRPLAAPGAAPTRAPGTLAAHYAPRARLRLASAQGLAARLAEADAATQAVYSRERPSAGCAAWRPMPADAAAVAHELFAVLRELDTGAVRTIWVEQPGDDARWEGVRDRLRRAAAAEPATETTMESR